MFVVVISYVDTISSNFFNMERHEMYKKHFVVLGQDFEELILQRDCLYRIVFDCILSCFSFILKIRLSLVI